MQRLPKENRAAFWTGKEMRERLNSTPRPESWY
jgi:hypothetical protein